MMRNALESGCQNVPEGAAGPPSFLGATRRFQLDFPSQPR